jgi:hypothetical protein
LPPYSNDIPSSPVQALLENAGYAKAKLLFHTCTCCVLLKLLLRSSVTISMCACLKLLSVPAVHPNQS